ncbi:MAG: internalin A, partial [Myxococcota bacterium]
MPARIKTIKAAVALAAQGPEAIAGLASEPGLTIPQRTASIRALGLIGGPEALEALGTYREDHKRIVAELLRAAASYPPDVFGPAVFAGCPLEQLTVKQADALHMGLIPHMDGLRRLTLRGAGAHLPALSSLGALEHLTELLIDGADHLEDLSGLAEMPELRRLAVSTARALCSLDGLSAPALESLTISEAPLADLSPLTGVPGLRTLYLWLNTRHIDLSPVSALTGLRDLTVNDPPVADLSPVASMPSLSGLSLKLAPTVTALPTARLPALKRLMLYKCAGLEDIRAFIDGAPGLYRLSICQASALRDISSLSGLSSLSELKLTGVESLRDLSPLAGLTGLTSLQLRGCAPTDLAPLAGLTRLRTLHLERCDLPDLTPLSGLVNLQNLYLRGSQITDLSPLAELPQLRELDISHSKSIT